MRPIPTPPVPWQLTGNHWLAIPCIHPADGSIHAVGVLSRGARGAVEVAGSANFLDGTGEPLLRPVIKLDRKQQDLGRSGLAWERALNWLPTFTCTTGSLVVRGTVFAPYGRDADIAGAVYVIGVENRGSEEARVAVSLEGRLGHRQTRIRTPRPAGDPHQVSTANDVILLEGAAPPGAVALAIAADEKPVIKTEEKGPNSFSLEREQTIPPGGRVSAAFYVAAGPERDGAEATVGAMRRRGWSELLTLTREALQAMDQTVGHDGVDRLINRNLLLAYFYAAGRALDDAHFYLVRTRAPWHGLGVTVREWEALSWTLPAVQLADAPFARELLLRACELHGYAPGSGVHYLDGTLFEPGFSLEGAAAFAIATDRYIRETGDDQIVEEPAVADTLYLASDDIAARRHEDVPLYTTEVGVSGGPVTHPYTLHGNAVVAQALDVFRRTLDEETARTVQDPEAVRAALRRHLSVEQEGRVTFAAATDLAGRASSDASMLTDAYWLPLYGAVERHDTVYRRTVKGLASEPRSLAEQCARLMGPEAADVLRWLRRAALDNGLAAELVDVDGRAIGNGADASLAGLLAWSVWYAVHALGVQP